MSKIYLSIDKSKNLQHHGVKGMRWGVRKVREYLQNKKINKRNFPDVDPNYKHRVRRTYKDRNTKAMTDEELRQKLDRLQLENRLNALAKNLRDSQVKKLYANRNALSNDALKKINNRLNLEYQLKQELYKEDATILGTTNKIRKALKNVALNVATDYVFEGRLNGWKTVSDVLYETSKATINNHESELYRTIATAQLNKNTGRNRQGDKIK